jgi:hypothetical protein
MVPGVDGSAAMSREHRGRLKPSTRRNLKGVGTAVVLNAGGFALGIVPWTAAVTLLAILGVSLYNFRVDPYRLFRRAEVTYYSRRRFLNAGLIRTEEYDTVLLGSSVMEYLRPSAAERELGGRCLKLCIRGLTAFELGVVGRSVLKVARARLLVLALDTVAFRGESDRVPRGLRERPWHLYRFGLLSRLRYLLSLDTFRRSRRVRKRIRKRDQRRKLERELYGYPEQKRVWSRESVLRIWRERAQSRVTDPAEYAFEKLRRNFDLHVAPLIRGSGGMEVWIYYPPYSVLAYVDDMEKAVFGNLQRLKAHVFETIEDLPNVRLHDFQDDESITHDLDEYYDLTHYSEAVNLEILRRLAKGRGVVTSRERVEECRRRIEAQALAFRRHALGDPARRECADELPALPRPAGPSPHPPH